MSNPNKDEPKLIIDEDWKTQVQREKERTNSSVQSTQSGHSDDVLSDDGGKSEGAESSVAEESSPATDWPPASFDFLVTMLATQALMALGQFPGPDGKLGKLDKPMAKHYIDLLNVLETKTQGNLESSEKKMLSEILHNLRMTFVSR